MLPDDYIALQNVVIELIREQKRVRTRLSVADSEINDIYHYIESHSCDAVTNSRLMKLLKRSLSNRRNAKQYLSETQSSQEALQALAASLETQAKKEPKGIHYKPKSNLMKEFENGKI